jgi:hypothetical protein
MPKLDISPRTSMIESMRRRSLTVRGCMAEIFDNSFDAGANDIEVTRDGEELTVRDNGRGVIDMSALFALGAHESEGETIGRYGVGFKDAAIWLADAVEVDSFNGRQRFGTHVNWPKIEKSGSWEINISETFMDSKTPTYTSLVFRGLNSKVIRSMNSNSIDQLAYEFAPGLRAGARIQVLDRKLTPPPHPELTEEVHINDYFEGKHYRLLAGIKANTSEPRRYGYDVAYRHRLMLQHDSRRAFGDYSALRFYGYLELLDDGADRWTLGTHKQEFEEREDLYDHLFEQIEPLLKKADEAAREIQFNVNVFNVETILSEAAKRTIREVRQERTGTTEPGKTPSDTGRKRRKAKQSDPEQVGSVEQDRSGGLIRIQFDEVDERQIGSVQEGRNCCIVHVNKNYKHVDFNNFGQVMILATALYANHWSNRTLARGSQYPINFEGTDEEQNFILQFSRLLRNVRIAIEETDRFDELMIQDT